MSIIRLSVCLALTFTSTVASAATLMGSVGVTDAGSDALTGSSEFSADDGPYDLFAYDRDADADPVGSPTMPRMIGTACGARSACAAAIEISFSLSVGRADTWLEYNRYGGETDEVYVDGVLVGTCAGSAELEWTSCELESGDLGAGVHTITLEALSPAGAGLDGRHHIDAIELWRP